MHSLNLIYDIEDLIKNIKTLEKKITSSNEIERKVAEKLVCNGRVFVMYKKNGEFHFAPSRFIGYLGNTLSKHNKNTTKDGKETTPKISQILRKGNQSDKNYNEVFTSYANQFGHKINKHQKSFWLLKDQEGCIIEIDIN